MKILQLRFQNLNSLRGEWAIDFTGPEYVSDGIFAITGPTGSGKSTILDAICLALYGRTPRLKGINQTANEIMSRQSGACFAEVVFAIDSGQFRCHWGQHRARRKPDGKLAAAKHEISDAISGEVLETSKREVAACVEEKTGMDFERFSRSMLLAQGSFDAFLQAAPSDRSAILEQITGTEIYSDISKRVHERNRAEVEKLVRLQLKMKGLVMLTEEEAEALSEEIASKHEFEKKVAAQHETLGKSILWLKGIFDLKKQLADLTAEATNTKAELKNFEPNRQRLRKGLKAAELDSEYATLVSKRKDQQGDVETVLGLEQELPELEKMVRACTTRFQGAEQQLVTTKTQQKMEQGPIKEVRGLDLQIAEKKLALHGAEKKLVEGQAALVAQKKKQQALLTKQVSSKKELQEIDAYLTAHRPDTPLVTDYSGLVEQFNKLQFAERLCEKKGEAIATAQQEMKVGAAAHQHQQKQCGKAQEVYKSKQILVAATAKEYADLLGGRLLREYRLERENLLREKMYLGKIADLEEERNQLQDGSPCPLCGALHHPFAEGNIPLIPEIDQQIAALGGRIQKAEDLEVAVQQCKDHEQAALASLNQAEQKLSVLNQNKDVRATELKRLQDELQEIRANQVVLHEETLTKVAPFQITELPGDSLATILQGLETRKDRWLAALKTKEDLQKASSGLSPEISGLEGMIQNQTAALQKDGDDKNRVQKQCDELTRKRHNLYGDKNPDGEEKRLELLVAADEEAVKNTRKQRDAAAKKRAELQTRMADARKNIAGRQVELEGLESLFLVSCEKGGFQDEPSLLVHQLLVEERNDLSLRVKSLDERQASIVSRQTDREGRLTFELAKELTGASLEDLQVEQHEVKEGLRGIVEDLGKCKQRIADHCEAQRQHKSQQSLIKKQQLECNKIAALHGLIGSADGKKFSNFAQGLTFELMVSHANQQLVKMTDRYLLVRDEKQPLELNVVDNYQAGEVRSTKNLSGGESFIVSLALALGLSKMASRKVRVDSLFLDEGFGTLDEDALETALETLSGLQQDGKLIGVISHVSALKERISTQINVQPLSGGKSVLSGPGCVSMVS